MKSHQSEPVRLFQVGPGTWKREIIKREHPIYLFISYITWFLFLYDSFQVPLVPRLKEQLTNLPKPRTGLLTTEHMNCRSFPDLSFWLGKVKRKKVIMSWVVHVICMLAINLGFEGVKVLPSFMLSLCMLSRANISGVTCLFLLPMLRDCVLPSLLPYICYLYKDRNFERPTGEERSRSSIHGWGC